VSLASEAPLYLSGQCSVRSAIRCSSSTRRLSIFAAWRLSRKRTLDRNLAGPDHRFSCEPAKLSYLVREVRCIEAQLGRPTIEPTLGEIKMRDLCRRSVVAARELRVGTVITQADLVDRGPGTGLPPYEVKRLIDRKLSEVVPAGHVFTYRDIG
jgi:N,N'-diacetyllegionaminate synthase